MTHESRQFAPIRATWSLSYGFKLLHIARTKVLAQLRCWSEHGGLLGAEPSASQSESKGQQQSQFALRRKSRSSGCRERVSSAKLAAVQVSYDQAGHKHDVPRKALKSHGAQERPEGSTDEGGVGNMPMSAAPCSTLPQFDVVTPMR